MTKIRLYLALERLNLAEANWDSLVLAMKSKGSNTHPLPNYRNHWAISLDKTIHIFEAEFESANVDVESFMSWLSNEFGIPADDIGEQTGYNKYGRFSTFSYPDGVTDRFRLGVFGFIQGEGYPTHSHSHIVTLNYTEDNIIDWQEEQEDVS